MPRQPLLDDAAVQRMKDAYVLGGASLAKLSVDFGISVPTVSKYLKTAGVDIRPRGRPRKDEKDLVPTDPSMPMPDVSDDPETLEDVASDVEEGPRNLETPVFNFGD